MKANRMWLFSDVLEKNKRVFKVPVYQRNYDWTNIQCEKLFQDIMKAGENNRQHFTGTVVYIDDVNGGSGLNEVLIIDGQQRIKIVKSDVSVAKNYLTEKELSFLERIVSLYLDYAELQAERHIPMSMEDWAKRLDGFLEFNGTEILTGAGKISAEQAKLHAETEFEKYRVIQDRLFMSDYDRYLLELEEKMKE